MNGVEATNASSGADNEAAKHEAYLDDSAKLLGLDHQSLFCAPAAKEMAPNTPSDGATIRAAGNGVATAIISLHHDGPAVNQRALE